MRCHSVYYNPFQRRIIQCSGCTHVLSSEIFFSDPNPIRWQVCLFIAHFLRIDTHHLPNSLTGVNLTYPGCSWSTQTPFRPIVLLSSFKSAPSAVKIFLLSVLIGSWRKFPFEYWRNNIEYYNLNETVCSVLLFFPFTVYCPTHNKYWNIIKYLSQTAFTISVASLAISKSAKFWDINSQWQIFLVRVSSLLHLSIFCASLGTKALSPC